jgi:hypothetical protein
MVLNHLHWSSVYKLAEHHVPNNITFVSSKVTIAQPNQHNRMPKAKEEGVKGLPIHNFQLFFPTLIQGHCSGTKCHKFRQAILIRNLFVLTGLFDPDFRVQISGFGVG